MSHRVVSTTNITNAATAARALTKKGWDYNQSKDSRGKDQIHVQSGPMAGALIDLSTGKVEGDTDFHGHDGGALSALDQAYGEEQILMNIESQGGYVVSREMVGTDVRIVAQVTIG